MGTQIIEEECHRKHGRIGETTEKQKSAIGDWL